MLEVCRLSVRYQEVLALRDVSFAVPPGTVVGIIGPNGAGKSTLLKAMLHLIPRQQGQVFYRGQPLPRQRVSYLPQRSHLDWRYPVTVRQVVMMGRARHTGWFRYPGRRSRAVVEQSLGRVGLGSLGDRPIKSLSGGQQQRMLLARTLAQETDVLFLDEPLAAVDHPTEELIWQIYRELAAEGKTLVISCHDWGETLLHYDRLLLLNQTAIAFGVPRDVLSHENLQRVFQERHDQPRSAPSLFC
ncbi:MAG: ABC transporter ATP-binding protein [Oscillatoriales cyanobacterium SM2_2_1]|nr:ABC transporter ATP-binding protein [Oscillatoriales cyanobacterium SM2_2_1]